MGLGFTPPGDPLGQPAQPAPAPQADAAGYTFMPQANQPVDYLPDGTPAPAPAAPGQPGLLGGQYQTPQALEQAHANLLALYGRQANEVGELRRQVQELASRTAPAPTPQLPAADTLLDSAVAQLVEDGWEEGQARTHLQTIRAAAIAPLEQQMQQQQTMLLEMRGGQALNQTISTTLAGGYHPLVTPQELHGALAPYAARFAEMTPEQAQQAAVLVADNLQMTKQRTQAAQPMPATGYLPNGTPAAGFIPAQPAPAMTLPTGITQAQPTSSRMAYFIQHFQENLGLPPERARVAAEQAVRMEQGQR